MDTPDHQARGTPRGDDDRSPEPEPEPGLVDRAERWTHAGQQGATVWITGLPAAGKSTLAAALELRLVGAGLVTLRLDGDNVRHGLCSDLGFSADDRRENVRRVAHVARLAAESGLVVVVALISPYRRDRERARALHEDAAIRFLEVFVDTPLEECVRRDPKGLYARAMRGQLDAMTGIHDAYEPPAAPEIVLRPASDTGSAAQRVLTALGIDAHREL